MDDDICPGCGNCSVWQRGKRSSEDDYECGSCNLAYSISGSDWPAIEAGAEARLSRPDANGRIWLRPTYRADLP